MSNLIYSPGVLDGLRLLSNSTLTGTCNYYSFQGTINNSSGITNRGGVQQSFNAVITGIPCRFDNDIKSLIPQRAKQELNVQKVPRYVYLSLEYLQDIGLNPKVNDQLESTEGDTAGNLVRYRVLDVNTETDEVDVELLVELM